MIILCNKKFILFILLIGFTFFLISVDQFWESKRVMPVINESSFNKKRIIIDPGHGGIDRGSSYTNLVEKNINLDLSLKLKRLLSRYGADVIMTRYKDTALDHYNRRYKSRHKRDLQARVDIINHQDADLFISIHTNYFSKECRIRGPIVFYQENKEGSKRLAERIQSRLNKISYSGIKMLNNQIRRGDYFILNNSQKRGVLIEVGFINKKVDRWLLDQEEFRNILVYSICQGLLDYIKR